MKAWSDDAFAGYLAAMIDGEGCIEVIGAQSARVRIANTIRPTLEAMRIRMGFGKVIEYARPKGKNYRRLFCLEVANVTDLKRLFDICGRYIHMKRPAMTRALLVVERVQGEVRRIDERNQKILAAIKGGQRQIDIAAEHGVSPQLVSRLKRGHTWPLVITGHRARALTKRFPTGADQSFRLHGEPK